MNSCQFIIADFLANSIQRSVQVCFDQQSGIRSCMPNQFNNDFAIEQRTTSPVLRDVAELAMLDLVPLARSRREMAHAHCPAQPACEILQADLPQPTPRPIPA